jgi:phosphoglycolate phosphatase-like HAD superfamily hydrolase
MLTKDWGGFDVDKTLGAASLIFWDFDGVIKDSVDVKTLAYERLFLPCGREIASRVRLHHESNGGVSRFDKIPIYLTWAREQATPAQVEAFCARFSQSVLQAVIDAPWVPGVREYLLKHFSRQYFVLVTATPQEEIEQILAALDLSRCFGEVHGAPTKKSHAIKTVLSRLQCAPAKALMIGDAETDLQAAKANSVPFLLRRTPLNLSLQAAYSGPKFDYLNDE